MRDSGSMLSRSTLPLQVCNNHSNVFSVSVADGPYNVIAQTCLLRRASNVLAR